MTHTITYNNYRINCYTEGSGEVIAFLHGWPTNARLWQAQVEALQVDFQTLTLDWLGFGQSDKPTEHHYTFTKKQEILDAVFSKLLKKEEKVTIVAHDIGGPPAILWAHENEHRVKRLILLNTVVYPFKTRTDALSEVLLSLPLARDLFVSKFGLRYILRSNTKSRRKSINQQIETIVEAYQKEKSIIKWKTILEPLRQGRKNELLSLAEKFRKLDTNKYLVIARQDPLCFAHSKQLSLENPEVPTHYIPDCGHFIPIDQPEALSEILMGILKTV